MADQDCGGLADDAMVAVSAVGLGPWGGGRGAPLEGGMVGRGLGGSCWACPHRILALAAVIHLERHIATMTPSTCINDIRMLIGGNIEIQGVRSMQFC